MPKYQTLQFCIFALENKLHDNRWQLLLFGWELCNILTLPILKMKMNLLHKLESWQNVIDDRKKM